MMFLPMNESPSTVATRLFLSFRRSRESAERLKAQEFGHYPPEAVEVEEEASLFVEGTVWVLRLAYDKLKLGREGQK